MCSKRDFKTKLNISNISLIKRVIFFILAVAVLIAITIFLIRDFYARIVFFVAYIVLIFLFLFIDEILSLHRLRSFFENHCLTKETVFTSFPRRKEILKIFLLFSAFFFSTFSFGFAAFNNSISAAAHELVASRKIDAPFNYFSIISEKENDKYVFLKDQLRLIYGSDMQKNSSVCFHSPKNDEQIPFSAKTIDGKEFVDTQVVSLYTYSYQKQIDNYGFKLMSGNDFEEDSSDLKIYVTQSYADKILNVENPDYSKLLNYSIEANTTSGKRVFTIVDVISDQSLGYFKTVYGSDFVFCNFNSLLYYFHNPTLDCIVFGNRTSTASFLSIVDRNLSMVDGYKTEFYDYSDLGFKLGQTNKIINYTKQFYSSYLPRVFIAISSFAAMVASFFFAAKYIIHAKRKSAIKHSWLLGFVFDILIISSFILVFVLLGGLDGIVIGDLIFVFTGYQIVTILVIMLFILAFLMLSYFSKKSENSMIYFDGSGYYSIDI